jgi:hypothetical protein
MTVSYGPRSERYNYRLLTQLGLNKRSTQRCWLSSGKWQRIRSLAGVGATGSGPLHSRGVR